MATNSLVVGATTVTSDTNATVNTVVCRDSQAGIYGHAISGNNLITSGNLTLAVSSQSASFTAGAAVKYLCNATSGAITVTLPTASAYTGVEFTIMKTDSSGNAVTISGVSGTGTLSSQYAKTTVFSDGSTWWSA
jgi:hypothetical protein